MRLSALLNPVFAIAVSSAFAGTPPHPHHPRHRRPQPFLATAYCRAGETQSGATTRPGIIAADPRVLPTGSIVRISGLGTRPQTYIVEDRGVTGRHVDLFIRSCRAAKRFGRRRVLVRVVKIGDGERVRSDGRLDPVPR